MHKSWFISQVFAMPLFTLFGFWGFYLYGIFNQQATFSVQFSAQNPFMITYNIFALVGNLLPSVYNQLAIFLKVELQLGVMPTDWWKISFPEWARFPSIPPVVFRFLFRTAVLVVSVFTALATLTDGIGNIQGLVGALAVAAFSFYLPWLMYWRVFQHEMSIRMKMACAFWFILGFGVSVAGTYTSIIEMTKMSGGFLKFPETACAENSFYMGVWGGGGVYSNKHKHGAFSRDKGEGSFYATFYQQACHAKDGIDGVNILCAQPDLHCCSWNTESQAVLCNTTA